MSILVTGGAGFIGSHLVERLLQVSDQTVVCVDNFDDFYSPQQKRDNLRAVLGHPRFVLVEGDIRDLVFLRELFRTYNVTDVMHLAAHAGVRPSLQRPRTYVDVNVGGTVALLEVARECACCRFLCASSSTVYGVDAPIPFQEDCLGSVPASPYGATKRAAELFCRLYHQLYGLPTLSLRYFSVYGPRLRPDLALYIFAAAIRDGRPLPLFGGGVAQRDFTYIDDIIDGTIAAWRSPLVGTEVNLGHHRPVAIRDVVRMLEECLGQKARIEILPEHPGEMPITCADIRRARDAFGYEPRVPLEEGLPRFVEWFRTVGSASRR
jgi:UDP-glucuronate 4-epimerase